MKPGIKHGGSTALRTRLDYENGSWWQELDADNKVTTKVWDGKQDIYHLLHCLVIPRIPLAPGMAPAVAAGLLDINAK